MRTTLKFSCLWIRVRIKRDLSLAEEKKPDSKVKKSSSLRIIHAISAQFNGNGPPKMDKCISVLIFKLSTKKLKNALANAKMGVCVKTENANAERAIRALIANIKKLTPARFFTILWYLWSLSSLLSGYSTEHSSL